MSQLPSGKALAVAVAVLALAAAAGAVGSADFGDGIGVDSDGSATPSGGERLDDGPAGVSQPSGSGDAECGLPCSLPTARSLLGLVSVPLSPALLAGGAVLAGLVLLAVRSGTDGPGQPTDDDGSVSADGTGCQADPTATVPRYDGPEERPVVAAFRRLRAAVAGGDGKAADSLTPRDVHQAAVESGYDPAAVETVVGTFEAVRYGEVTVTAERERAVEDALATLGPEVSAA